MAILFEIKGLNHRTETMQNMDDKVNPIILPVNSRLTAEC